MHRMPMPVITTSAARLFVRSSPPADSGDFLRAASESAGRSAKAVRFSTKVAVLPPPPLSPRELPPALPPQPPLHPLHPSRSGRTIPRSSSPQFSLLPPSPPLSDTPQATSPLSELSEDDCSSADSANPSIIEKPSGEAGRPGRGGYNLRAKMEWDKDSFSSFQENINKLIDRHLNISKCYTFQRKSDINVLKDKAILIYPDLPLKFRRCWPLHDHIRLRLSYTSGRERRCREKAAVNRLLHGGHFHRESSEE